jgi:chemotaxis protein CheZ
LKYVAELTEKAADRVLNATEKVQPLNDTLSEQAKSLEVRWNDILTKDSNIEDFKKLVYETHTHFIQMSEVSNIIKNELMEIIMAQDFQDLTGQVIKKLITITSDLESKLLEVLVHHAPNERPELTTGLSGPNYLETPALNTVANQEEVDNLLESLGF